jgi:hypothetical protein
MHKKCVRKILLIDPDAEAYDEQIAPLLTACEIILLPDQSIQGRNITVREDICLMNCKKRPLLP